MKTGKATGGRGLGWLVSGPAKADFENADSMAVRITAEEIAGVHEERCRGNVKKD